MSSTIQTYSQAIADFQRLQGLLVDKQSKIGADSKASTFAQLGSDLTNVQSFKLSMDRSDRFINSIADANRKNDAYFQAMQQLIDIATDYKKNLALESSATNASVNDLTSQSNNSLDTIKDILSTRDGANFIFGGSKTTVPPVDDLKNGSNIDRGVATANYYNGDDFQASVDVSNNLRITYGINASDPAFQKLIGAINLGKSEEAKGAAANYSETGTMLDDAISGLIALQTDVGDNATTFENSTTAHSTAKATFQQQYSDANSPDVVQLTIETSQIQTALQASFSVFAKISQLSLLNFL
jgi:flagellar hook-associated protein 3 FlgL